MSPPIRLVDYVPENIVFEVDPAYRLDAGRAETIQKQGDIDISIDINWTAPEVPADVDVEDIDHPDEAFFLNLAVLVNDEEEKNTPYRIRLRLAGMFQRTAPERMLEDGESEEEYLAHTLSSGISMLYGAARSEIASMTSQAPYGKFLLPPISPMQAARSVLEEDGEENEDD